MKKKLFLIAVIVLLVSIVGYGTYAFTTVEAQANNVITTSGVKIALVETRDDGSAFPSDGVENIIPGAVESKIVKVQNTGPQPAWVRMAVTYDVILADGTVDNEGDKYISLQCNSDTGWELDEQRRYFYYTKPLAPGETTTDLFKAVDFSADMGNEYQDSTVKVNVHVMATQAKNNGDNVWDAAGWPDYE